MKITYPEYWPQFYTATIYQWQHLLAEDKHKDIIVDSLKFLVTEKRIELNAFVIMSNHIHLIWQPMFGFSAPLATRGVAEDTRDEHLGAFARVIRTGDDREIALIEPFTEGRLAAALARHGEGFVALYLIADRGASARARAAGIVLSAAGLGPFGTQRLVIGGPRSGPFIAIAAAD